MSTRQCVQHNELKSALSCSTSFDRWLRDFYQTGASECSPLLGNGQSEQVVSQPARLRDQTKWSSVARHSRQCPIGQVICHFCPVTIHNAVDSTEQWCLLFSQHTDSSRRYCSPMSSTKTIKQTNGWNVQVGSHGLQSSSQLSTDTKAASP